jgi:signal transduction histidine kinase
VNHLSSQEKAKPFRLVKYFAFISLISIFLGTIALSLLNTHWARRMHLKKSEDYALLLVANLNHQIFSQFFIPMARKFRKIQLRDKEQFDLLDKVVRSTLHSFKIDTVNIYDMNNIISYSFNPDLVGKKDVGGTAYQNARQGRPTSKLTQSGNFLELFVGIPKVSKIITFAPLRATKPLSRISGPVGGVIEIVQDLSGDYKTIFRFQIFVVGTGAAVMGILFITLTFVVRKGENIIQQRALERMKLREELSRAEHLSSLGEMIAGVSHEIRNPLGIIKSSAELLRKKESEKNSSTNIPEVIVEEAGRLNNIITDFLNFAKPRSPNFTLCQVEEVLEKNISFYSSQIEDQNCSITKRFEQNLPKIMADADMLYQAFLNILINAMQAMPEGGEISIKTKSNDNGVTIFFEDDGEGISDDAFEKIWTPFYTTKEKGTGLGLGIVKNIIGAHGGEVYVENRPQGGARVGITLPIKQEGSSWKPS